MKKKRYKNISTNNKSARVAADRQGAAARPRAQRIVFIVVAAILAVTIIASSLILFIPLINDSREKSFNYLTSDLSYYLDVPEDVYKDITLSIDIARPRDEEVDSAILYYLAVKRNDTPLYDGVYKKDVVIDAGDTISFWYRAYTKEDGKEIDYASNFAAANPTPLIIGEGALFAHGIELAIVNAGITPNDSLVGTLAIYTYKSEGKTSLPSGEDRLTSRLYADIVQQQIVNDLRASHDSLWSRRHIWDRGYRESRTPSSPAMLLELLSHQNFADMKYGLDPTFRFDVSRAVYKGMLKYLSNRYGIPYTVQPLPVSHMSTSFVSKNTVEIGWMDTADELEPTAFPTGYILYTRIDDGAFDTGKVIEPTERGRKLSYQVKIEPGHIYSFMIQAFNDGGKSFMSEKVSVGLPETQENIEKLVLVVNNFDRVSGPVFFDTPDYAGFDNSIDSGVPYIRDISFIGEMYQNHRNMEWISNDNPGFGGSHQYYAGKTVAGNTFDFAYVHGKAIMEAGYPFHSCSNEAFSSDEDIREDAWCVDLICGKQVTTVIGSALNETRYTVFTEDMQKAITDFTEVGGHVLVSGAYIATDIWSGIYQYDKDEEFRKSSIKFAEDVLGYRWSSGHASRTAEAYFTICERFGTEKGSSVTFHNSINEDRYCIESPDGISPRGNARTFLKYADTDIPAGICKDGKGYKTVCLGFPIETLSNEEDIENIISLTLEYFSK